MLSLSVDRQHLNRNVARVRIELQAVQDRPAQHVRQEHVEDDCRHPVLPRQCQCRPAAVGHDAFEALVASQGKQHARVVRIVVGDEQDRVAVHDLTPVVGNDLLSLRPRENRRRSDHDGQRPTRSTRARHRGGHRVGWPHVRRRQIQGKRAPLARRAREPDFAAEQHRELTTDRQPKPGAAVVAAGAGVGLLECLEDESLLLARDANARVGNFEGDRRRSRSKDGMIRRPSARGRPHGHRHGPLRRELEGIGQQILEDLLQTLGVAAQAAGQRRIEVDVECQLFRLGHVAERSHHAVLNRGEGDLLDFHRDGAGFDFREIEDVVDQREQVGTRRVDGPGELDLLRRQIAGAILAELLAENQDGIERRAQLVGHVREELGLVLRGERELRGLLLERAAGLLDLLLLALHFGVLFRELPGL